MQIEVALMQSLGCSCIDEWKDGTVTANAAVRRKDGQRRGTVASKVGGLGSLFGYPTLFAVLALLIVLTSQIYQTLPPTASHSGSHPRLVCLPYGPLASR